MKPPLDAATRKDMVEPREGVRLLEFCESQMPAHHIRGKPTRSGFIVHPDTETRRRS